MSATKVTLRKRALPSGKITLYLDFYPPIRNHRTMQMSRREYLGIYIAKNPRTPEERNINAEKLKQAEAIRAQRELSIINEQFGFIDKTKQKMDFLSYFKEKLPDHDKKWSIVYEHFSKYVCEKCTFADIRVELCTGFRTYLLKTKQLKHEKQDLAQNSAAGYWSTFRGVLALALKEKYLLENINEHLDKIDTLDTRRQFLNADEVQALYNTPCQEPVLKAASLFSCLTGLRFSDILAIKWENLETYPDGGHCIRLRTEKTEAEALNPISQEAYDLCGEKSTGLVFKGFKKTMLQNVLPKWLQAAGITKHITFHMRRHTHATLLLSLEVPIETVSKILGHSDIKTTQIYAKVINKSMRDAVDKLDGLTI
ncbi:MAG: Tyrosine recombinase XerD [Candidatus Ordinivivax streblomastigis]|uniref:Tyrosine recombinase XerD n=1 Tax=Candidatus Ordinivivax streblomastigis TaxID=2540710 RepID=A0A5M8P0H6_9BACT|nr:MAG: Tyrosine recombinase XerD [Candidatus Ordinivivax streblomastigis]